MRHLPALLAAVLLLASCRSFVPPPRPVSHARFLLESTEPGAVPIVLPQSGVRILVAPAPVVAGSQIVRVAVSHGELGEALVFQLTPAAIRALDGAVRRHPGARLVLTVDGRPVGARRIGELPGDGLISVFVEVPDSELPAVAAALSAAAAGGREEGGSPQ